MPKQFIKPKPKQDSPPENWGPAAYLIDGKHCADGRDIYRPAKVRKFKNYVITQVISGSMWYTPGLAVAAAERSLQGLPPDPKAVGRVR